MALGALGAIAGGINRGMDLNQRDRELEEQRAFRQQDRDWQQSQRDLVAEQQKIDKDLREGLAKVKPAGTEYEAAPGYYDGNQDVPALKRTQSAINQAREEAALYKKAGKDEQARTLFRWADEKASTAAAERALGSLRGLSKDASTYDIAQAIAPGIDADDSPIGVDPKSIVKNDDGSVSIKLFNKLTGYSATQTFKDAAALRDAVTYHYAPEYARKQDERRAQLAADLAKENAKPINTTAGGITTLRNADGSIRETIRNNTGFEPTGELGADGQPILRRIPTSGAGSGSGAGKGGKPEDLMKPYTDAFEFSSTKGEGKLPEDALARGQSYLPALAEQGVKPQVAALIARDAAVDPTKTRLEIDHATGRIDRVYMNKDVNGGRPVRIAADAGTVADLDKQAGKDVTAVKQDVQTMLGKMVAAAPEDRRQAVMQSYIALASDPTQRNAFLKAQLDAGKAPEAVQNLARQLEIIGNYVKPEAPSTGAAPASKSAVDRIRSAVGGIRPQPANPNSPAGQFQARQEKARQEEEARRESQAESSRQLSSQFQKDKGTMDPVEFARKYDAIRMKLSASDAAELRRIEQSL